MMDNLIWNYEEVSARISALTDVGQFTTDEFITAFTKILAETLQTTDSVTINDFGTFYKNRVTGGVVFVASDILADAVNQPFSNFEKVELAEGYYPPEVPPEETSSEPMPAPFTEQVIEETPVYAEQPDTFASPQSVPDQTFAENPLVSVANEDYPYNQSYPYNPYAPEYHEGAGYQETGNDDDFQETLPTATPAATPQPYGNYYTLTPETADAASPAEPTPQTSSTTQETTLSQQPYEPYGLREAIETPSPVEEREHLQPYDAAITSTSSHIEDERAQDASDLSQAAPLKIPRPDVQESLTPPTPPLPSFAEETENVDDKENEEESSSRIKINKWIFWLGLVIGLCAGTIVGFFLRPIVISDSNDETSLTAKETMIDRLSDENMMMRDSVEQIRSSFEELKNHEEAERSTAPVALNEEILDTIKPGRFLAAMSRAHYDGRYEFWVYIYEENKDKIPNPDNVDVGTVLVIPPREKYGIDPNSQKSIERALEFARKISSSK